jgi:pectin methylesterase-like acyl-CoA thioesterase
MIYLPALRRLPRRAAVRLIALATLVGLPSAAQAQLAWNAFNETTSAPAVSNADGSVTVTVPAGARTTLYATNFVPVDFSAPTAAQVYVTANFKVSGGLSSISGGTRAIGFGLYNNNGTNTGATFADDAGYFTWLNGRTTGSIIELRRRNGDGTSPSLLNPTGSAFNSLGTGTSVQTAGTLSDSGNYALQLHLVRSASGVSLGTSSSTTTAAGVWLSGDGGLSQTAYTNPDNPPAATVFNEVGFMFLNTTAAPAVLTLSLTGLTAVNPPSIVTQPQALSVNPGQTGILFVTASGTAPLTYQWSKAGTPIAGATGSTLSLSNVQSADAAAYTVAITNAYGSVTSNAANVTVTASPIAPVFTTQPSVVTVAAGTSASFTVTTYGSAPLTYQWQKNGAAIAGATSATFTIASPQPGDAASYTVVVQNGAGSVTSSAAVLTVNTAPAITSQPAGSTLAIGQAASFAVTATGTPAPTYQWLKNGVNITGATSSTYNIAAVAGTDAGVYTVRIVNSVGAVTSSAAPLIIPSTMTTTGFSPSPGATGVNPDTPLKVTFDRVPAVGNTGRIRIYRASDNAAVDTLDFGSGPQTRTVGTNSVQFYFFPILVTGNTATIYPHAGVLAYGQSYYVTIDAGVIQDSTGASFTGIANTGTWTFATKSSGPAANAAAVTVSADGSADFTTVQGAIDFVPINNTQRVTITVKKGLYNEINYIGSSKPFITLQGEDRAQTIIAYSNNNNFNTLSGNNRAMFGCDASDFILQTITLHNTTPLGGSQAEAFRGNALRILLNRVNLASFQDTFLINGTNASGFVTDSYIEGDVDFMWGSGAVYFQRCELKALNAGYYTQIRNGAGQYGNVYVDCRLTGAAGLTSGVYLGRIDPTPGNFPYSQAMYLNCAIGPQVNPVGWLLNNASSSTTVQYWEYRSTDLNGGTLDVSKRLSSSRQLTDAEAALYRNPAVILHGWVPQIAPTIETSPVAQTVVAGGTATLSVVANGSPEPMVQWYENGVALPGATGLTYTIANAQAGDSANYSAIATSTLGTATSAAALLTVGTGPYAGTYFGTASAGYKFALFVRNDGSGVYLATGPGGGAVNRTLRVDSTGKFSFSTEGSGSVTVTGAISGPNVTGTAGTASLTGTSTSGGPTAATAGYFQTGVTGGAGTASLIVGSSGQALAVVQASGGVDSGLGTVTAGGAVAVTTAGGSTVAATIAAGGASASVTVTPTSGSALTLTGAGDTAAVSARLREISTSARVDANNSITVGFIVTGGAPDTVLIRGIGPSLGDEFAVAGALSAPRLDVYTAGAAFASNVGWIGAVGTTDIALSAAMVGAFPLRDSVADSALRLTLEPGNYTAVLTPATSTSTGIGLLEVYDVSQGSAGQRLSNFSSIGAAGTGSATLIAGLSVGGTQPKRVLIRGVGPGLGSFGIANPVGKPVLSIYSGTTLLTSNTNWNNSVDAANLAAAATEVGAFALSSARADSAVIVDLAPGVYTAQLTAADGILGTGLIEVYELP